MRFLRVKVDFSHNQFFFLELLGPKDGHERRVPVSKTSNKHTHRNVKLPHSLPQPRQPIRISRWMPSLATRLEKIWCRIRSSNRAKSRLRNRSTRRPIHIFSYIRTCSLVVVKSQRRRVRDAVSDIRYKQTGQPSPSPSKRRILGQKRHWYAKS